MKNPERHMAELMDKRGMSAPALAEAVGCSRQNIYCLKRGSSRPHYALGLAIGKVLGVNPRSIFFGRLPERLVDSGAGGGR